MADLRLVPPSYPLDSLKLPEDVRIRLAELELELSEGNYTILISLLWCSLAQVTSTSHLYGSLSNPVQLVVGSHMRDSF